MARETKVGLLAGLAFIICFAIILANRGRQDLIANQLSPFAERSAASRSGVSPKVASPGVAGRVSGNDSVANAVPGGAGRSGTRSMPQRLDREASSYTQPGGPSSSSAERTNAGLTAPPPHGGAVDPNPSVDPWERVRLLEQRLSELAAGNSPKANGERIAPSDPGVTLAASSSAQELQPTASESKLSGGAVGGDKYTVAAGDTLFKIAQARYGGKSSTIVNSIFDANRGKMTSPNDLKVGMELILPVIADAASSSSPGGPGDRGEVVTGAPKRAEASTAGGKRVDPPPTSKDKSKDKAPKPSLTEEKTFRWYQVSRNDRYTSIAREQLGDAARWKEIHALNKEKFPDAGQIREGVRIKLPMTEVADSRERRH